MIKKLTAREQKIFIVCMAVLFVYAGYGALIKPLMDKVDSVDGKIYAYQKRLNKSVSDIQKSKEFRQQYNEYLKRFKQSKTDEQVMTSILSEIEKVSGEFGLLISELKSRKVKHGEQYNKFSVSLTINSELINILRFLHTLQRQPHFFDLEKARFDKVSRRKSTTIKTNLVLSKILIP